MSTFLVTNLDIRTDARKTLLAPTDGIRRCLSIQKCNMTTFFSSLYTFTQQQGSLTIRDEREFRKNHSISCFFGAKTRIDFLPGFRVENLVCRIV